MTFNPAWLDLVRAEIASSGFASWHVNEISPPAPVVDRFVALRGAFAFVQVWIPLGVAKSLSDVIEVADDQSWESATIEPTSFYIADDALALEPMEDELRTPFKPLDGQPPDSDTFLTNLRDDESSVRNWEYSLGLWVVPHH